MSKTRQKEPKPGSFSEAFAQRLTSIEERARAAGENMTTVCKAARISRAGPVRWRRKVPHTIALIDRMETVVTRFESGGKTSTKT